MKRSCLILFLSVLVFAAVVNAQEKSNTKTGWKNVDKILEKIKAPKFPDKDFDITNYGASADGKTLCTDAFNKAIEACSKAGGGRVAVPRGEFLTGAIHLKSNINLYISEGAVVKFSTNPKDYLPVVFCRWEGTECMNYSPLIYAYGQKNIAVTGKGTFDGQASSSNWWAWKGSKEFGWEKNMPSQKDSSGRPLLVKMNNENVPVEKRIFGAGRYLRPNFVQFYKCENILLKDVTFLNSPMWVLNPVLSQNISIINVSTIGTGPNTDGCDPSSCKNVLIKNCKFKNGDDCIAIKSGRNNDGRRIGVPSENIVIQGCKMEDGHGGVTIGSEISGGCKNVFAENCKMDSPNLDRAIRLKSNTYRGGLIENVFIRNIKIGEVKTVAHFDMKYEPAEGSNGGFLPVWRNIEIENVSSTNSHQAFYFVGLDNSKIHNINIKNCNFREVKEASEIENVDKLKTENVFINGKLFKEEKN